MIADEEDYYETTEEVPTAGEKRCQFSEDVRDESPVVRSRSRSQGRQGRINGSKSPGTVRNQKVAVLKDKDITRKDSPTPFYIGHKEMLINPRYESSKKNEPVDKNQMQKAHEKALGKVDNLGNDTKKMMTLLMPAKPVGEDRVGKQLDKVKQHVKEKGMEGADQITQNMEAMLLDTRLGKAAKDKADELQARAILNQDQFWQRVGETTQAKESDKDTCDRQQLRVKDAAIDKTMEKSVEGLHSALDNSSIKGSGLILKVADSRLEKRRKEQEYRKRVMKILREEGKEEPKLEKRATEDTGGRNRESVYMHNIHATVTEIVQNEDGGGYGKNREVAAPRVDMTGYRKLPEIVPLKKGREFRARLVSTTRVKNGKRKIRYYEINVQWGTDKSWIIFRSYDQFLQLDQRLLSINRSLVSKCKLPPKVIHKDDDAQIDRFIGLAKYIQSIGKHQEDMKYSKKGYETLERFLAPIQFNDLKEPKLKLPFRWFDGEEWSGLSKKDKKELNKHRPRAYDPITGNRSANFRGLVDKHYK